MTLFSQRNAPRPDHYRYNIDERVRRRLLIVLQNAANKDDYRDGFTRFLIQMQGALLARYGGLRASSFEAARMSHDPAIEHFFRCHDEEVIDFLVFAFQTEGRCGGQETVVALNEVLSQEHIGYEITDLITEYEHRTSKGPWLLGGKCEPHIVSEILPQAIRKSEQLLHSQTIQPALGLLKDPRFSTANNELRKAFAEYRQGDYGDAVTDAGAAFETVLKTICTHKKWAYDPHKDTCSALLEICRINTLFPPFYRTVLEGTATVRNKMGDAHGKGPTPEFVATKEYADHMLYMVCNNINLLITLAKL